MNNNWKEEFREYFDKCLKPKKPGIKNLYREILVDFIEKVRNQALEEIREKIVELSFDDQNDGYGTIVKLKDILAIIDEKLK